MISALGSVSAPSMPTPSVPAAVLPTPNPIEEAKKKLLTSAQTLFQAMMDKQKKNSEMLAELIREMEKKDFLAPSVEMKDALDKKAKELEETQKGCLNELQNAQRQQIDLIKKNSQLAHSLQDLQQSASQAPPSYTVNAVYSVGKKACLHLAKKENS